MFQQADSTENLRNQIMERLRNMNRHLYEIQNMVDEYHTLTENSKVNSINRFINYTGQNIADIPNTKEMIKEILYILIGILVFLYISSISLHR
jgi:hypothetical protein